MNKIHATVTAALATAGLVLTGCTAGNQVAGTAATSAPVTTIASAPVTAAAPASTPASSSGIAKIGREFWFTYPDGLQIQISSLHKFKVSANAITGTPGMDAVAAQVTVRNGTAKTFDVSGIEVTATWGPDGYQAIEVWDDNTQGSFRGTIPSKRAKTSVFGFEIPRAGIGGPIAIEVRPDANAVYDSAQFEGTAK